VEDSEAFADTLLGALKESLPAAACRVTCALEEVEAALSHGDCDLILSDYNLGRFDAGDVLKARNRLAPEIPVILLTGSLTDETAVELLKLGADDYLIKDRLARLPAAIEAVLKKAARAREFKAACAKAQENATKFNNLFEVSSDLIILVSEDGTVLDANAAFLSATGYSGEVLGKLRAQELVPAQMQHDFNVAIGAARTGRSPVRFETAFLSSAGGHLAVEGAFYPRLPAPGPAHVQGIFRDITDQRALEAQLRQAQKMEALGRLAGGVAHDFNNMLGAIEGYASLGMRNLAETDQLWSDLNEIRRAVAKAAALTGQLLLFSRKHRIERSAVSIPDIMEGLRKMLSGILGEKISLEISFPPVLPPLNGDAGQLEQVLVNLVLNARDAMPGGGVIRIKTGAIPAGQAKPPPYADLQGVTELLRISVADSGSGMSPEVVRHLFEPFFTTKERGKGTGLGLSTAYGIINRHNGWISVETGPGGSEFSVFLPACAAAEPAKTKPLQPAAPAPAPGSGKVLVIEDDEDLLNMAAKALDAAGYRVLRAATLAEGLGLLRANTDIRAAFSDIMLPDGNATESAGEMLRLAPGASLLFTSGYVQSDDVMRFISERGYKFLLKPYSIDALLAALSG
jgi:PAS domain S-box-containing protein